MANMIRYFPSLKSMYEELFTVLKENLASPLRWSLLLKPDTIIVTHRIRKYVLDGDAKEAWRLKKSYKDTFAMEAVAAAIIAQIAITMLSLSNFGTIHWTATAFAYTSLVSGLLSTFFSFYVQQILSDMQRPEDVRKWLTTPRMSLLSRVLNNLRDRHQNHAAGRAWRDDRVPSLTAAATLTAPSRLLTFSIATLFVALGVYLGSVYTAKLGALKGRNANLAVLLFFIIFATWAIMEVLLPLYAKQAEQIDELLVRDEEAGEPRVPSIGLPVDEVDAGVDGEAASVSNDSETEAVILEALKASIHAQEESLKAQKALLKLLL